VFLSRAVSMSTMTEPTPVSVELAGPSQAFDTSTPGEALGGAGVASLAPCVSAR
jgi:hypothetical protein